MATCAKWSKFLVRFGCRLAGHCLLPAALTLTLSKIYMWHPIKWCCKLLVMNLDSSADKKTFALSKQYVDHICPLAFSSLSFKWFVAHFFQYAINTRIL